MEATQLDFSFLRGQIVGIDAFFRTPYGERLMTYCDYTASGRGLAFVENYLMHVQRTYANTHTEDDVSGRSMTRLLQRAEETIKEGVNAGPHGKLIAVGAGSTGAIDKFQQILGVQIPPATMALIKEILVTEKGGKALADLEEALERRRPVVFVGPYEHHSNEVTWRQGLAEVVTVGLAPDGRLDLAHLERLLGDPAWDGRLKIGSFSAASNVTGIRTPVHEAARLLHARGALAAFDYAACAPYVEIDMNPPPGPSGGDPSLDAVFISPHKFLGGPGSSGILVFHERIYRKDLPPTVGGGGTVDYVGEKNQDFMEDIEAREKAGTPGVLQTMKAALAFEVKRAAGVERIEKREKELLRRAFARWDANPNIEILGNRDPDLRVAIVSFNVRDPRGGWIHPRLLTVLLNDLFGIQSRAGCSCAGPYGHRLLGIGPEESERFRKWVLKGCQGIKPGWCRVGFHFTMDDEEADFVIDAVDFLGRSAWLFVPSYCFDIHTGHWGHCKEEVVEEPFSIEAALEAGSVRPSPIPAGERKKLYDEWLREAEEEARRLASMPAPEPKRLEGELGELQFFTL